MTKGVNVGRRVAVDDDEIGEQARCDRPAIAQMEGAGVHDGRRLERLRRRHAVFDERLQLARVVAMGNAPTSLPLQIGTPAASAALKLRCFSAISAGSESTPLRQPLRM